MSTDLDAFDRDHFQCHLAAYGSNSETSISSQALGVRVGVVLFVISIHLKTDLLINAYKKELGHTMCYALAT